MEDRGVIASAEVFADLRQGAVGHLSAKVHGDLPRMGKLPLALGRFDVRQLDAVLFADGFFDGLAVDIEIACGKDIVKILSGVFHIDVCLEQLGITDDTGKSALQFTDVELDFFCDQIDDFQDVYKRQM